MSAENKKSGIISLRCTKELRGKINAKADKFGVFDSVYIIECIEENLKRNTKGNKHKVKVLVELQENVNQLLRDIDPENQEVKDKLMHIMEGAMDLWDF